MEKHSELNIFEKFPTSSKQSVLKTGVLEVTSQSDTKHILASALAKMSLGFKERWFDC